MGIAEEIDRKNPRIGTSTKKISNSFPQIGKSEDLQSTNRTDLLLSEEESADQHKILTMINPVI
jgi:hypothetical protein